jgi:small subunit ribosomal protein S6
MRIYEELYIARPGATEEDIDALNAQLDAIVKQSGGKIDKVDKWGSRKLAYKINKCSDGQYVLIGFQCGAQAVREVERRLRVSDLVLKFMTTRMDEKLQWLEKRKKAREKRAARKPPPVAAPALPASMPAAPGVPGEAAPMPGAPASETKSE